MIIINSNTRQFNVPGADLVFGVVADSDAERKYFQCPRYVGDGLDLASCFIRINYRNANGKTDFYLVDDMVIDGDNITFTWLLSPKVTEYRGQVKFVMCAVGPDLKLKWHTTQGTGQVMEGLEPDNSHVESQTSDVVAQLIAMVEAQTSAVEKVGADQVAVIKSATETHRTAAVNEIEAKRANSLASIPNDYTSLSTAVESLSRDRAGGIVCSVEGEVITLNDASNQAFRGMRIFGKSTQNGVPTPENPVEIVSVGDGGKINTTVAGWNLLPKAAAGEVSQNGVTLTSNGNGSYNLRGTSVVGTSLSLPLEEPAFIPRGSYFHLVNNAVSSNAAFVPGFNDGTTGSVGFTMLNRSLSSDVYSGKTITSVGIYLQKGYTVDITFSPMLTFDTATEDFESFAGQTITISTPNGLPGIPVTSGGNYTDAKGQQWICDEVDFERGVYVQRIAKLVFDANNTYIYKGISTIVQHPDTNVRFEFKNENVTNILQQDTTKRQVVLSNYGAAAPTANYDGVWINNSEYFEGRLSIDGAIASTVDELKTYLAIEPIVFMVPVAEPIETPLSETELAAYRALHTNKPNTTILNDSGAYMSVDYTADTKLYIDNKIKEALL